MEFNGRWPSGIRRGSDSHIGGTGDTLDIIKNVRHQGHCPGVFAFITRFKNPNNLTNLGIYPRSGVTLLDKGAIWTASNLVFPCWNNLRYSVLV